MPARNLGKSKKAHCRIYHLIQKPIFKNRTEEKGGGVVIYIKNNFAFEDDGDEFRFNDASTDEGHFRLNSELTWFCNVSAIMMSYV